MENISTRMQPTNLQVSKLIARLGKCWRNGADADTLLNTAVMEIGAFLRADGVQVYQLQPETQTPVLAEIWIDRPTATVNAPTRDRAVPRAFLELLHSIETASIVDVITQRIRNKAAAASEDRFEPMQTSSLTKVQAQSLEEMGVRTLLLAPLQNQEQCWGMMAVYCAFPRTFLEGDLETLQSVAELLSIALHQDALATAQMQSGGLINSITQQLHLPHALDLKAALNSTVSMFGGIGGRLYLFTEQPSGEAQLHTAGVQPATSEFAKYPCIEQYKVWQNHFETHDDVVWTISDVYQEPKLQGLQSVFQPTGIQSLLMIPLWYQQQPLGYLSIFRGRQASDPASGNHQSFGNSRQKQVQTWSLNDIQTARELGVHFAAAVQRSRETHQVQSQTSLLEQQIQQRTETLQKLVDRQQVLLRVTTKIRQSLDINTIFRTTTRELCQAVQAERVAVYRFREDWGGEFVSDFEYASNEWDGLSKLGVGLVWNDTYLQETQGGRYRFKETSVVEDVYAANLSPCHVEILEQYQIRSNVIAPIFRGTQLWGLLAMYQHSGPRSWKADDVEFLNHVSEHLGVAIQQAYLLNQTHQQTSHLQQLADRQQALLRVTVKIRQSLNTDTIFRTTTQELCQLVHADRAAIYRFNEDWGGEFVNDFDFATSEWNGLNQFGVNVVWDDTYLQETQGGRYRHKETFVVDDIAVAQLSPCHVEILEQFQIRAQAIAPIFRGKELWGLLALYQQSGPRHWQQEEVEFLNHVAEQLGVALQQAKLAAESEA